MLVWWVTNLWNKKTYLICQSFVTKREWEWRTRGICGTYVFKHKNNRVVSMSLRCVRRSISRGVPAICQRIKISSSWGPAPCSYYSGLLNLSVDFKDFCFFELLRLTRLLDWIQVESHAFTKFNLLSGTGKLQVCRGVKMSRICSQCSLSLSLSLSCRSRARFLSFSLIKSVCDLFRDNPRSCWGTLCD